MVYLLSKLLSTRNAYINHLYIHETLRRPIIENPEVVMAIIYGNSQYSYISLIIAYIEHDILPSNPTYVSLMKRIGDKEVKLQTNS